MPNNRMLPNALKELLSEEDITNLNFYIKKYFTFNFKENMI